MPARREPHTPPTTPPKSRNRRNGSRSSLSSQGSQKYTAILKERPNVTSNGIHTPENDYSRENEIYGTLRLANSQPTITLQQDTLDDDINNNLTNQFVPTDRGINGTGNIINNNSNNDDENNNNNNNENNINNNNSNNRISSIIRLFDFIGYIISLIIYFIKNCFNFLWNLITPSSSSSSSTTTTTIIERSNNKWLICLLIFIIIILLLFSDTKFGMQNKTLRDYFPSTYDKIHIWPIGGTTYKIQPIRKNDDDDISNEVDNNKNNDSIILTLEDFRQMIIAEVRNHMNSEDGKHLPSLPTEPLRSMISAEVKQITNEFKSIVTSEVKKSLTNIRSDTVRFRGSLRGEEMLEIIRKEARQVVKDELLKYSQDKLNKPDFALHSGGAKVIGKWTSKTFELWPDRWYKRTFAYLSGQGILRGRPPVTAISHDTNVGQCWPFPGQEGQLAVLLNRRIFVKAVTYDHVSKDIAVDVFSAPKDFEVWGIVDYGNGGRDNKDDDEELDIDNTLRSYMESTEESCGRREDGEYVPGKLQASSNNGDELSNVKQPFENLTNDELRLGSSPLHFYLGRFTYDISGLPVQTFEISQSILKQNKPIRAIIMRVTSNWGKPEYTCLYRFRVHGEPADKADS